MNNLSEYILLRVQTEEQHTTPEYPVQVKTKFFPILSQQERKRITIPALTGELALENAKGRFPMLRFSLCVQEVISYDQSIARITKNFPPRSKRVHRTNEIECYSTQSPDSSGGGNHP